MLVPAYSLKCIFSLHILHTQVTGQNCGGLNIKQGAFSRAEVRKTYTVHACAHTHIHTNTVLQTDFCLGPFESLHSSPRGTVQQELPRLTAQRVWWNGKSRACCRSSSQGEALWVDFTEGTAVTSLVSSVGMMHVAALSWHKADTVNCTKPSVTICASKTGSPQVIPQLGVK